MTTEKHVHMAICEIKKILASKGGITKERQAPDQIGGYKFRGIDDMDDALCGLTAAHNIVLYPRVVAKKSETQVDAKGRHQRHVELTLEVDIVSAVDGSSHTIRTEGEGIDTGDKATGKAFSNARKQAVLGVFQIPVHGESSDIEAYVTEVAPAASLPPIVQKVVDNADAIVSAAGKPGPKKARAPKDETQLPVNGTPIPANAADALIARVGEVNTFPLLYAVAQDADATPAGPAKNEIYRAVKDRAIMLFAKTGSMKEVQEGFPLVKALGQPDELKRAANEAYGRFRSGGAS